MYLEVVTIGGEKAHRHFVQLRIKNYVKRFAKFSIQADEHMAVPEYMQSSYSKVFH